MKSFSFTSDLMETTEEERNKRFLALISEAEKEDDKEEKDDKSKDDKESKNDRISVVKNRLRRLKFKQYLRDSNKEDEELIEKFKNQVDTPENWEKEEHLGDLYPSVWLRREQYVIQVYARVGELAAQLGKLKDEDFKRLYGDEEKEKGHNEDFLEEDFVVIQQLMPPFWLDRWEENEDTGEEKENFDLAKEHLDEYVEDAIVYLDQLAEKEDIEDENKETKKKKDNGKAFKPVPGPSSGNDSDERALKGDNIPPYAQNAAPYNAYNN